MPETARDWVEPLVTRRWPAYDVRFPGLERTLRHAYATIPSARVDAAVRERLAGAPGCEVITGEAAVAVGPRVVRLENGRALEGTLVVDARGPGRRKPSGGAGFQKFVGLELRLEGRRPRRGPVVMDATVAAGRRLPLRLRAAPRRGPRPRRGHVLLATPMLLDREALRERALAVRAREGALADSAVVREEEGVLPLPWAGPLPRPDATRRSSPATPAASSTR